MDVLWLTNVALRLFSQPSDIEMLEEGCAANNYTL
jgi:hypothetical protein